MLCFGGGWAWFLVLSALHCLPWLNPVEWLPSVGCKLMSRRVLRGVNLIKHLLTMRSSICRKERMPASSVCTPTCLLLSAASAPVNVLGCAQLILLLIATVVDEFAY